MASFCETTARSRSRWRSCLKIRTAASATGSSATSKTAYQLYAPELNASFDSLRRDLTAALEQAGLYPKEAAAMIETWRDSWFEEGMRVIYLMPPRRPWTGCCRCKVTPAPKEVQRVFVGRVELLSPWTERTIRAAMETNDTKTLDKFERFLTARSSLRSGRRAD